MAVRYSSGGEGPPLPLDVNNLGGNGGDVNFDPSYLRASTQQSLVQKSLLAGDFRKHVTFNTLEDDSTDASASVKVNANDDDVYDDVYDDDEYDDDNEGYDVGVPRDGDEETNMVESFCETTTNDDYGGVGDKENDYVDLSCVTPNAKSRVPTHAVTVQTPATLPPPKQWSRAGGRLQRSSPPTTPLSVHRKTPKQKAGSQHAATPAAATPAPPSAPTAPPLTASLATAHVSDLLARQIPEGDDGDGEYHHDNEQHQQPSTFNVHAAPDYEPLYQMTPQNQHAPLPTSAMPRNWSAVDLPASGETSPDVFASPAASPRGSYGCSDPTPAAPVTAATAWLHCLAYEACVQLCMDAAGDNSDTEAQMHALAFLTRACMPLRDAFGLHHVLLRKSRDANMNAAGAPPTNATTTSSSAMAMPLTSDCISIEVVRVKQKAAKLTTSTTSEAPVRDDVRESSLSLRASLAAESMARGLHIARKVGGKLLKKVYRNTFRVHLRLTSWSEDRVLRASVGAGSPVDLPLGALAATDARSNSHSGSASDPLAAALTTECLEMLVFAGSNVEAKAVPIARGRVPLSTVVASNSSPIVVSLESMAQGIEWGRSELRISKEGDRHAISRADSRSTAHDVKTAHMGSAISADAAYDALLSCALYMSHFGRTKLSLDPGWQWLVTNFGSHHGVSAVSRSLRYVRHVVLEAQSPSTACLVAISDNLAPALQCESVGNLPTPDARLLNTLKGPVGSLLALCFEAYKDLGGAIAESRSNRGGNGSCRPSDPGTTDHGAASARTMHRRGSAPTVRTDMSLSALGGAGSMAYPATPGSRGLPMVPVLRAAVRLHSLLYDPLDPSVQTTLSAQLATAARRRFTRAVTDAEQASLATECASRAAERRFRECVLLCRSLRTELALDKAIHATNCLPSSVDLPRIAAREYGVMVRATLLRLLQDHPPEKPDRNSVELMHAAGDLQNDVAASLESRGVEQQRATSRPNAHALIAPGVLGETNTAYGADPISGAVALAMGSSDVSPLDTASIFQSHVLRWVETAKMRLVSDASELDEVQAIGEVFGTSEVTTGISAAATTAAGEGLPTTGEGVSSCASGCGAAPATPGMQAPIAPTQPTSEPRDALAPAKRVRALEAAGGALLDAHDPLALRWPDRHAPLVEDALCSGVLACVTALERQRKLASQFMEDGNTGGVTRVSLYARMAHRAAHSRVARRITGGSSVTWGRGGAEAQTGDLDAGAALHLNSLLALIQLVPSWHSRVRSWSGQPAPSQQGGQSTAGGGGGGGGGGGAHTAAGSDEAASSFQAPALANICSAGSGEGFVHVASECRQHFTTAVRRVVERLFARMSLSKRAGLRNILHMPFAQNEEFGRNLQPLTRSISETRDLLASCLDRRAAAAVLRGLWDMNARELVRYVERTSANGGSGTAGLAWGVSVDGPVAAVKSLARQVRARSVGAPGLGSAGMTWLRRRRAQEALASLERVFRAAIHETLGRAARDTDARPPHHAWKASQVLQHAASAEAAMMSGAFGGGGGGGVSHMHHYPVSGGDAQLGFDVY